MAGRATAPDGGGVRPGPAGGRLRHPSGWSIIGGIVARDEGLDSGRPTRAYIARRYIDNRYIMLRVSRGAPCRPGDSSRWSECSERSSPWLRPSPACRSPADRRRPARPSSTRPAPTSGGPSSSRTRNGIVHVNVHVQGLTPGLHGIHIHAIGACGPTFAAAGGHYNPLSRQHGLRNDLGAHAGDLPNLIVNANGVGHLDGKTDRVTLTAGPTTLFDVTTGAVGSSFIIHANEDDQVTDATNGNSGGRIACGVIVAG